MKLLNSPLIFSYCTSACKILRVNLTCATKVSHIHIICLTICYFFLASVLFSCSCLVNESGWIHVPWSCHLQDATSKRSASLSNSKGMIAQAKLFSLTVLINVISISQTCQKTQPFNFFIKRFHWSKSVIKQLTAGDNSVIHWCPVQGVEW